MKRSIQPCMCSVWTEEKVRGAGRDRRPVGVRQREGGEATVHVWPGWSRSRIDAGPVDAARGPPGLDAQRIAQRRWKLNGAKQHVDASVSLNLYVQWLLAPLGGRGECIMAEGTG